MPSPLSIAERRAGDYHVATHALEIGDGKTIQEALSPNLQFFPSMFHVSCMSYVPINVSGSTTDMG
jgi:hypothetical protein